MNNKKCLLASVQTAIKAGNAILEVYRSSDFKVEEKADKSPLTLADKLSHKTIVKNLAEFAIPILSEEGKDIPFEQRNKVLLADRPPGRNQGVYQEKR